MIAGNLQSILEKLPSGVQLVAVSKFHPVEQIREAYAAGQRVFAESRPQELAAKVPQMPADVQWHFIGHLQTNKLKLVLPYVYLVQSVDSIHLLEAINNWALTNGRVVDVLLELHLGAEETKQGFTEDEILDIATAEKNYFSQDFAKNQFSSANATPTHVPLKGVRIRGLMGMATNTEDMSVVEGDFERIEALFRKIQAMGLPDFTELSIGMSGDWPLAVRHGATMVRIGTDIFGPRV
jgi:hypothetical protein